MSAQTLLLSLFRYKAWADEGLTAGLTALGERSAHAEFRTAIRILNHAHIVDRIFAANLQLTPHAYAATDPDEAPKPDSLFKAVKKTDQWYIGYIARLDEAELAAMIEFPFSDGMPGRMSREEMLGHIIAHGGYHRGEIGRIMTQLTRSSPRDTFTGYLHETEPARRERMR
ncbi:damage-inducible protein DinB [Chromobacterium sphagni]|uniref:Damage-inducible protein DinB n=1 Tax=Chromobacterium sphagni TaxID=1903179 RepID=A0A1S1WWF1_9NEIS|nr:DinB family protein [Chromobacterium sphagni]OHX11599.1 damage-inducible protein DinB [Chromobacterium sphagni]